MHASRSNFILLLLSLLSVLAGGLMIGFAIPFKEFGFGNALITSGTTAIIGGLLLFGLANAVRQLSQQLESFEARPSPRSLGAAASTTAPTRLPASPAATETAVGELDLDLLAPPSGPRTRRRAYRGNLAAEEDQGARLPDAETSPFNREAAHEQESFAGRDRGSEEAAGFAALWPTRRAASAEADSAVDRRDASESSGGRHARNRQPVAIVKSGVIDGMAYTVYADGSIEAELPQGVLRFASIEELRAYLASKEAEPPARQASGYRSH